jgi:ribosomal protein L37AE/L43A
MSSTGRPRDASGGRFVPRSDARGPSPADSARAGSDEVPARCPFCGSEDTERIALFGSSLLVSQHYCRGCRTVFERLKR